MDEFDMILYKLNKIREQERANFCNSINGKIFNIIVDFKCYMYSKNKFYNLTYLDFNKYVEERNKDISFDVKMKIFEDYFGFKFEFNYNNMKWMTKQKGDKVLNFLKE